VADIINPDAKDLRRTIDLAKAIGVSGRCRFDSPRIEELAQLHRSFQLITCMSVLEHIVDDVGAIRVMWSLLAPGGRLLVSVPCAASAFEEHSNLDEYGLLESNADGFVFWQRFYDRSMLERLFAITGLPVSRAIYGERKAGNYDADVVAKRSNPGYPRWREPYATVTAYAYQNDLESLPGMGVIAMEFAKPATPIPENSMDRLT
jgi:SAM-dependent methyltransferase